MIGVLPNPDDQVEDSIIMRALNSEVVDAVWQAIEPLLPAPVAVHPLGGLADFGLASVRTRASNRAEPMLRTTSIRSGLCPTAGLAGGFWWLIEAG